ncbi:hypothetical protein BAE44_0019232, partial [Dichanthelium oligosanthes]
MAIAETAARKLLHGGAIGQGVADVGGVSLLGLWELVTGFFANIIGYLFAALTGVAHLLVLPLELLWQWLVTIVTGAAGAISSGIDGLWQHVTGFFAGIFSALAGAISSGLDSLWQHVTGFFAALAGAVHQLVLPVETIWKWLATTVADAGGAISSGLDGLWQLVTGFFPQLFAHIFAALAGAAHEVPKKLEELWRWLQAAAAGALPFVLAVAAVLLLVALVWFCGPTLCVAAVGICKALVCAFRSLSCLLPPCAQCLHFCGVVTMRAPGTAGALISRAAFVADPALYFQILRAGGPVVVTAVFCTRTVAW